MATKTDKPSGKNSIISLHGFDIKEDTLYEIKEKLDTSAPDGFKDFRTTKILNKNVVDTFPGAVFDSERGIWDTGLYVTSKALSKAIPNLEAREIAIRALKKYIVTPIETQKGKGILDHTVQNNRYWDEYSIDVERGRIFDTSKTDDLLKLYFLLLHKRVTPKDMESHPAFKQPISSYCIVDKDGSMSREAEKSMQKGQASAMFYNLLKSDKDGLLQVLEYLNINASNLADESVLYSVFDRYIEDKEDKYQNVKLFLETVEKYNTEAGQEELYIHSQLKKLYVRGKVALKRGEVWLDDIYVENGWKNAAKKILDDKELKEVFATLID